MKTVKLSDLNNRLPFGYNDNGNLTKPFELKRYKLSVDRDLALWMKENNIDETSRNFVFKKVAKLMHLLVERVGNKTFVKHQDKVSTVRDELLIKDLYATDIIYLLLKARIASAGELYETIGKCNACEHHDLVELDLNTLEFKTTDSVNDLQKWVELKHPFTSVTGEKITHLRLRTEKFSDVVSDNLETYTFLDTLQNCINGINNKTEVIHLLPEDVDEIDRGDLYALQLAFSELSGVDLSFELPCPHCKSGRLEAGVNWTLENFFMSSSQLMGGKNTNS